MEDAWVTDVGPDPSLPNAKGTQATYSYDDGVVRMAPSFLRDLATLVGREHLALPPSQRDGFIDRIQKLLATFHHELTHALVPAEIILSERRLYGTDSGDITATREAIVETAGRRSFPSWMKDIRAGYLERGLNRPRAPGLSYPEHVEALDALLDHLATRGISHEQMLYDMIQKGTSRAAMEHLGETLVGTDRREDVHGHFNFRLELMAQFKTLTQELIDHNHVAATDMPRARDIWARRTRGSEMASRLVASARQIEERFTTRQAALVSRDGAAPLHRRDRQRQVG
jgi:hypothetical protein